MALISCKECGAEISDKANSCPKCGYPINNVYTAEKMNRKVKKPIDKEKIKKISTVVIIVIVVFLIAKGFIHPNLKFEDLVFGDHRASGLLGYASGHNEDGKYWDNTIKLYRLKVDHLEYHDGWYFFYFSEDKRRDAYQIIWDHCNSTVVGDLYHDERGRLAIWWDGKVDYGDYEGYYRIKVTKSSN